MTDWTVSSAAKSAIRLVGVAAVLSACGIDINVTPPPADHSSLTIEATAGDGYPGDVTTLRATVRNWSGAIVPDAPVNWTVDNGARAILSASGAATFLSPGAVTFTARSGALHATRAIAVRPLAVTLVTVNPSPMRLDLLLHTAVPGAEGMEVRYRIPGDDIYLNLLYRREP